MKNKKMIKGIVAGVLGLALLLGGGTFALWYQTNSVATGAIQSGQLNFTTGTQTWTVTAADGSATPGTATAITNIANFRMVPGDTVTLTTPITVNAVGDTLKATLKVDLSGIAATTTPAGPDFAAAIKASALTSIKIDTNAAVAGTSTSIEITPSAAGQSHTVVLKLHFPTYNNNTDTATTNRSLWWGQTGQNQGVDLSTLKFDLAQHL